MHEDLALAIAVILGAGVLAQWLASTLRVPSVLILLPAGVIVGPVSGLVDVEALFGDALFPLVAIAVGIILFEGGLGLDLALIRRVGRPVVGLVTVGLALTWAVGAGASLVLFDLPASVALLLGAVLVVSGPTVVLPLLDSVQLREPVGQVLRWECIVIDPIGAVLAVSVFEAIIDSETGLNPLAVLLSSAVVGVLVGTAGGLGLALLLRWHLVPDRLHSPLTLAIVVGCFVAANALSVEAGLFATTVMGMVVANQRLAPIAHIAAFGEDVGVLLLGGLFIVLAATVELHALRSVLVPGVLLLIVLLAVRPLVVRLSTLGSTLTRHDRTYLALIAPRGVVAASVAALFSVSLEREGVRGAAELAPAAFVVIIGSVAFASAVARPAADRLRVAAAPRTGVLLAGDQEWLVDMAAALAAREVPVMLVSPGDDDRLASDRGLLTYQGALDDPQLNEAMEAVGVGAAVVAVAVEGVGPFLIERLSEALGRSNVYVVRLGGGGSPRHHARAWGRRAFGGALDEASDDGPWTITTSPIERFDRAPRDAVPLAYLRADGTASIAGPWRNRWGAHEIVAARCEPLGPDFDLGARTC